jgi:MFS transporter, putative metabolite:H+ symporter
MNPITNTPKNPWIAVMVVAFGYFVDLYDLFLFSSVRVRSLAELGITGAASTAWATTLMNWTVVGMVVGGVVWGMIGDRKGRLSVLFASIITYSVATGINAFVQDTSTYQLLRFVAGFGLAAELGTGITLITEQMPKEKRTYATMVISAIGMLGAVTAGLVGNFTEGVVIYGLSGWRVAFLIGAFMGFMLLIFRISMQESVLFNQAKSGNNRGDFGFLMRDKTRRNRFLYCILSGLPTFFIVGLLLALAKEFGEAHGLIGANTPKPATAIVLAYLGVSMFDIVGNYISKLLRSRKKVLFLMVVCQLLASSLYLFMPVWTVANFYILCFILGASNGIGWAIMITNAAEQFGTNVRAVVTASTPNFIRGLLFPLTEFAFKPLMKLGLGLINSAALVTFSCVLIAFWSISKLEDKFENDADYLEV